MQICEFMMSANWNPRYLNFIYQNIPKTIFTRFKFNPRSTQKRSQNSIFEVMRKRDESLSRVGSVSSERLWDDVTQMTCHVVFYTFPCPMVSHLWREVTQKRKGLMEYVRLCEREWLFVMGVLGVVFF